mgnify:CR=1 FL=1
MISNVTPAVPSLIRELNERRVLETVRRNGALHAAEIARHIGLSRPTTAPSPIATLAR